MSLKSEKELKIQIFIAQLILAALLGAIYFRVHDVYSLLISLVRYTFYLLLIRLCNIVRDVAITLLANKPLEPSKLWHDHRQSALILAGAAITLQYLDNLSIGEDFLVLFVADLVCQYPEMDCERPVINYGVGMACSYFEGYLMNIIPSDGAQCVGLFKNIQTFQDKEKVVFPVKKLFVVVTSSLYCPPDLQHLNKEYRPHLARLEACRSLENVKEDVAGVKNRSYRNSTYKIVRPDRPADEGVYVVAEFASPLNTFYNVLKNQSLYQRLSGVDPEEIKRDFCAQLEATVEACPATRGRVALVHFDDQNQDLNLADVLLQEIAKYEPKYDEIVRKNALERRSIEHVSRLI